MNDARGDGGSLDVTAAARSYRSIWRGCLFGGLAGLSAVSALLLALQTDIHAAAGAPRGSGVAAAFATGTVPTGFGEVGVVLLGAFCLSCTGLYHPRRVLLAGVALTVGAALVVYERRYIFGRLSNPMAWHGGEVYSAAQNVAWMFGAVGAVAALGYLWFGTRAPDGRTVPDRIRSSIHIARARRRRHRTFRLSRLVWMLPAVAASLLVAVVLQAFNAVYVRQGWLGVPEDLMRDPDKNRAFVEANRGAAILAALADIVQIVLTVAAVAMILRFFWRLVLADARRLLVDPSYRPIVFLRSFDDDAAAVRSNRLFNRLVRRKKRIEEVAATALAPFGAAIAIGKPNERLPKLGALRAYYADDEWQSAVVEWMGRAELIVLVAGLTHWTLWELGQVISRGYRGKLIVLLPPDRTPEQHARRCRALASAAVQTPWEKSLGAFDIENTIAVLLRDDGGVATIKGNSSRQSDYELALALAASELISRQAI